MGELAGRHGRLHAEISGPEDAPVVLTAHGLSANLRAWDPFLPALADRRVVALDLRGRGRSPDAGPHGIEAHADDLLAVADALGAGSFDLLGWSMGALIGLRVAARAPDRVRSLVLLDAVGQIDPRAEAAVRAGLARLDEAVDAPEAYVEAMRERGVARPWDEHWARYYLYELDRLADGRWAPRTSRRACAADLDGGLTEGAETTWRGVRCPVLLVRALEDLGGGLTVPEDQRDAFLAATPHAELLEVERNHFGVMTHPDVIAAVRGLVVQAPLS